MLQPPRRAMRTAIPLAAVLLFVLAACADRASDGGDAAATFTAAGPLPGPAARAPSLRIALFGDQGLGPNARAVLALVRREGARLAVILGDFDYTDDPAAWEVEIDAVLGRDFPVLGVVGNHDTARWPDYRQRLIDRAGRLPDIACRGDYGVNAACSFGGVLFVLSGAGTLGSDHTTFIRAALGGPHVWRVCAWHKNQTRLQVGTKGNEVGWEPYEACREGGAIIVNGHDHVYARTRTLADLDEQRIDPAWRQPDALRVGGGSTFVAVSGLGGHSVRGQWRCRPETPPYGCEEWASIYTNDQRATYGALFIDFHVDGDVRRARGYFKNIAGEVIDAFTITRTD